MHTAKTMKHWSHHLHDGMLSLWHQIDQHLHSRRFWAGVGIALLLVFLVTLIVLSAKNAPVESFNPSLYGNPYAPYR